MHHEPNSLLCRIRRERISIIGALGGCLVFSLFAHYTVGRLQPFELNGVKYDKDDFDFLSGLVTLVGGFAGALAAADFQRNGWRFSLRTLLIATTLVAVGLGVIVLSR